jgi:hypothetical protein
LENLTAASESVPTHTVEHGSFIKSQLAFMQLTAGQVLSRKPQIFEATKSWNSSVWILGFVEQCIQCRGCAVVGTGHGTGHPQRTPTNLFIAAPLSVSRITNQQIGMIRGADAVPRTPAFPRVASFSLSLPLSLSLALSLAFSLSRDLSSLRKKEAKRFRCPTRASLGSTCYSQVDTLDLRYKSINRRTG